MKLLTLNTHSIVEPNYEHKLETFVNEISRTRPDIIALQEVNQTHTAQVVALQNYGSFEAQIKSDNHAYRAVQMLSGMGIKYHWCYLPIKLGYDKYDEGLAVMSRYPITDAYSILLSRTDDYNNWRTRKALVVTTDNNDLGSICNVHMGWWEDEDEPFAGQWDRLRQQLPKGSVWLMGDFNSPDSKHGQGYDMVKADGWIDVYRCVQSDEGSTVPGVIDGWKGCAPKRIDYIWHNTMPVVDSCKVCFRQQQVSDHFGVMAEVQPANRFRRSSGVLMPVFSLPSEYGIGCFDDCAYRFVDFLARSGQSYWQILPLVSTSYGDSPYQSFSSFAGNPYFISLCRLIKEGLLDKQQCSEADFGSNKSTVDYAKLYHGRYELLKIAYGNWSEDEGYLCFCRDNAYWLEDYSLFMALKDHFGGKPWYEWDSNIKTRRADAMEFYQRELEQSIGFYKFVQYMFFVHWNNLKSYSNDKGVCIIGDIPIYVAYD
ncbi:MAG: 4-alpha-glucanotransferase, partial [Clostridia bacterium]|nr:4-alpha-glucanotransferase [Clostridia bacterium]